MTSLNAIVESNTVSINAVEMNKTTALQIASKEGHIEIITYLIENGADVKVKDYKQRNALELAIEKDKGYDWNLVLALQYSIIYS